MKLIAALTATLMLASCVPDPTPQEQAQRSQENQALPAPVSTANTRITVTRVGVFKDSIAYGEVRGIYMIHDHLTGQEFVGISGIGIAETASHSSGKTTTTDER